MAGYGLRAFLIAQSLNQIDKAYGPNHAILDNCHVRIAFATNDERTAKRISDALGTATELRAPAQLRRTSPRAVARPPDGVAQETARPLLTPGEVMQLPPNDEIVMVSGRTADPRQQAALSPGPQFHRAGVATPGCGSDATRIAPPQRPDDWSALRSHHGSPLASRELTSERPRRTQPATGVATLRRDERAPPHRSTPATRISRCSTTR